MSDKVGFVAASYHVLNVLDALCIQRILNIVGIYGFCSGCRFCIIMTKYHD